MQAIKPRRHTGVPGTGMKLGMGAVRPCGARRRCRGAGHHRGRASVLPVRLSVILAFSLRVSSVNARGFRSHRLRAAFPLLSGMPGWTSPFCFLPLCRSDELRARVSKFVFPVLALDRTELSVLVAQRHRVDPRPRHVELEANLLPQEL